MAEACDMMMNGNVWLGMIFVAGLAALAALPDWEIRPAHAADAAPDNPSTYAKQPGPLLYSVTSEGAGKIGADAANAAGYTGDGVRIAVLDTGFDIHNPEIAGNIAEHRAFVSGGNIFGRGATHGTAIAEIIVDIAPDAKLHLYNFNTIVEFLTLVDYIIARDDIDVVSMSISWPGRGPGDGTGRVAQKVAEARDNGILWINSAGNYANKHWQGQFSDPDSDGRHNFSTSDELLDINVRAGSELRVHLSWDDWKRPPGTGSDYDLCLYEFGIELVCSRNPNSGSMPFEAVTYASPFDTTIQVGITRQDGTRDANLQLFSLRHALAEYAVAKSSINTPADSRGAVSVGAVNWSSYELKRYSSQGPTLDGRAKPDISAPTDVTTTSYPHPFGGTSASAPHVAGAAALVMEKYPDATAGQIQEMLESTTYSRHAKSNKDGTGVVDLRMFPGADILALDSSSSGCGNNGTCFYPDRHKIAAGDRVTWINTDTADIRISIDGIGKSGTLSRGEKHSHTFGTDGTFTYLDELHSWATGKVIVGTGAAPRDSTSPTIISAVISGPNEVRVRFSESVSAVQADFAGITLAAESTARRITGISGSGGAEIILTFGGNGAGTGATGTISVGTGVRDAAGNAFAGSAAVQATDGQAPAVKSAKIISANSVAVRFTERITAAANDFAGITLSGENTARQITGISGSGGAEIMLTFGGNGAGTGATGTISVGTGATDIAGNALARQSAVPVTDGQSPMVQSARITGPNDVTIRFSEPVKAVLGDFAGITLAGENAARPFTKILGSGGAEIILTFGGNGTDTDAVGSISVGSTITDVAGNAFAGSASLQATDGQAPAVKSAKIISPNSVTVRFSEKVSAAASDFAGITLAGDRAARQITGISGSDSTEIVLTFGGNGAGTGATGTITVGNGVADMAGNGFAGRPATSVTDGQAPAVKSAKITGPNSIAVRFSEKVSATASDFADLKINSSGGPESRIMASAGGSGTQTIILTVSGTAIPPGITGTLDIAGTVQDLAGNAMSGTVNDYSIAARQVIIDRVTDSTPPAIIAGYPKITGPDEVTIIFTENVRAGKSHFTGLAISTESESRSIADISPGSSSSRFVLTVDGSAMPTDAAGTMTVSSAITDAAGNALASAGTKSVTDGQAPAIESARITSADTISIEFSESVNAVPADFAGFTLATESLPRQVTEIVGSGSADIVLTFAGERPATNATGTISIGDGITDGAGNAFAGSAALQVADGQAPAVKSARITSADTISVRFSEDITATTSDFTDLRIGNPGTHEPRTVTNLEGSGSHTIMLTVSGNAIPAGMTGTMDIAGGIPDLAGNIIGDALDDYIIANDQAVTDSTPPAITTGYPKITGPDEITITFTETVNAKHTDFANFALAAEDKSRDITDISPKSASDTFTLAVNGTAMPADATGAIDVSGGIADMVGNALMPAGSMQVADGQAPAAESAKITSPNALTIRFSEPVNATAGSFAGITLDGEGTARQFAGIGGSGSAEIVLTFAGKQTITNATGTIHIGDSLTDMAGNALAGAATLRATDGQSPTIPAGYPKITAPDEITIMFSETVNAEYTDFANFVVSGEVRPRQLAGIEPGTPASTFTLAVNGTAMPADATGTINVGGAITDMAGNALAALTGYMVADGQHDSTSTVSGTIFVDDNWNGIRDEAEAGYEGYAMYATDMQTGDVKTSQSGPDGAYSFELVPGNETIIQTSFFPKGHAVKDPNTSWFKRVTLQQGQTDTFDVGFHPVQDAEFARLDIRVFVDGNKNGRADAGEGIEGLRSFHVYTYTIGPRSIITGLDGMTRITDQVPADFGLFVDTAMLASEGYVWATTAYERSDDTAGKQYIQTYPVADDPESGSAHSMLVGLVHVRPVS